MIELAEATVESALQQAREAAGVKDVKIGATTLIEADKVYVFVGGYLVVQGRRPAGSEQAPAAVAPDPTLTTRPTQPPAPSTEDTP